MNRRLLMTLACAAALSAPLAVTSAHAQDASIGPLRLKNAWARPTPPAAPTGGGYVTISNTGAKPDRLIGGSTAVAQRLEIHEMSMDGPVMRMRKLDAGLAVPAGGAVELKPGGFHLMFIGLKTPLKVGDKVPVTLRFENAGEVKMQFVVRMPPAAGGHAQHGMEH